MARYLLAFNGPLPLPPDDLRLIGQQAQLLDTSRRTVLVETDADHRIHKLASQLPNWTISPETITPLPTTRPAIRKGTNEGGSIT
ncbi:hypothetical protein [Spirosoma rhododendri]|uniref:Uncharacterized protein n=1 Tax=Spirosoma rhododendri TaxID=2728024 RepID=A0A7L5DS48_9BACT|nr:hypothetical protein [Spirosoma rhododendri]QJD80261.1 hypothetical protein HH216_18925 [Spirosoma rhododendri]